MKNFEKYRKGYFMPPVECNDWVRKDSIDKAPVWCSVDLRDGNQALVVPMSLDQKLEFFTFLCKIGFKEIEVGFPAASETEYEFLRALIEKDLIPDDVTIQVLTQSREHIIAKTFEALKGAKRAIVHLYNSTSVAQREQVFKKPKDKIIDIAVTGAKLLLEYAEKTEGNFFFEYSPESFTGTEPEFALEICNAVIDIWKPTADRKVIINLPATVEMSSPHVYAQQIEFMSKNLHDRENVLISLHPHNDRGCAVADCELGLLAGADRIEGTLFGNGERTGNADIVTVAMNMYMQGVDPGLDFSDMPAVCEAYEKATGLHVSDRQPYGGRLVFAAFSGSHQDAIAKGMNFRKANKKEVWDVPYLPIDPHDVGRVYEADVIRINSQSGKGGVAYLLENAFGFVLPQNMRESFGYLVKSVSDHAHKELKPDEVMDIFEKNYVNIVEPIKLFEHHYQQKGDIHTVVTVEYDGKIQELSGIGNGRLDAVNNALRNIVKNDYTIAEYHEHALTTTSKSQAVAYVCVEYGDKKVWGVGIHNDIIAASVSALVSAINKMLKDIAK
ncbi:MAG TPA: 2-isopropylmalate synthase [Candidatus Ornithoclostridium faecavium]|nr:2-isopropylmalate synthase [Candidatus Ornithoclostridium faecavium]